MINITGEYIYTEEEEEGRRCIEEETQEQKERDREIGSQTDRQKDRGRQ